MKMNEKRNKVFRFCVAALLTYLVLSGPITGLTVSFPCAEPTLPRFVAKLYAPVSWVFGPFWKYEMGFLGSGWGAGWFCWTMLWYAGLHQWHLAPLAVFIAGFTLFEVWKYLWVNPNRDKRQSGHNKSFVATGVPAPQR